MKLFKNIKEFFSKAIDDDSQDRYMMYKSTQSALDKEEIKKSKLLSRLDESDNDNEILNLHKSLSRIKVLKKSIEEVKGDIIKGLKEYGRFQFSYYMDKSLNRERGSMPQISHNKLDDYILHFQGKSKNAKVVKKSVKISELIPSQNEFNEDKVLSMMANLNLNRKRRIVISKDNYIVDGHHFYAAMLELDPSFEIGVYQISLPISELLRRSNLLKLTTKRDFTDELVQKGDEEDLYLFDDWLDKASKKQQSKVDKVMSEYKQGTLNIGGSEKKVKNRRQAIAIALNEAGLSKSEDDIKVSKYAVAIIRDNSDYGKILFLLRSPTDKFHPNTWSLPGGAVEEGEKPCDAVKREVGEEINKEIKDCYLEGVVRVSGTNKSIYYYSASFKDDAPITLDEENLNYQYLDESEWKEKDLILDLESHLEKILKYGMVERHVPNVTV